MFKFNSRVVAVVGAVLVLGLLTVGTDGWTQRGPGGPGGSPGGTPSLSASQIWAGLNLLLQSNPEASSLRGNKCCANGGQMLFRSSAQNVTGNPHITLVTGYGESKSNIYSVAQGQGRQSSPRPPLLGTMKVIGSVQAMHKNKCCANGGALLFRSAPGANVGITLESMLSKKARNGSAQTDQTGGQTGQFVVLTIMILDQDPASTIGPMTGEEVAELLVNADVVLKALGDALLAQIDSSLWDEYANTVLLNLVACFFADATKCEA